jgi:hypothetical protein
MFKVINDKYNCSERNEQGGQKLHTKAGLFISLTDPYNLENLQMYYQAYLD